MHHAGRGKTVRRRDRNQYIFAPAGRHRDRNHGFGKALAGVLTLLIAGLLITNFIVSNQVRLEKVNLTILNLPADLEQYSILHLSDLHGAELGEKQKAIRTALGNTRYSCVIMTGDMLGDNGDVQPVLDLIALMPEGTPKYYIPGDTDGPFLDDRAHGTLSIYQNWAEKLTAAGVILLDRPVSETRGKGTIWFVPEEVYTLNLERMRDVYSGQLAEMTRRATAQDADDAARRRDGGLCAGHGYLGRKRRLLFHAVCRADPGGTLQWRPVADSAEGSGLRTGAGVVSGGPAGAGAELSGRHSPVHQPGPGIGSALSASAGADFQFANDHADHADQESNQIMTDGESAFFSRDAAAP